MLMTVNIYIRVRRVCTGMHDSKGGTEERAGTSGGCSDLKLRLIGEEVGMNELRSARGRATVIAQES